MKRLSELVKIIENNEECVILLINGGMKDLISLGCFDGDETMLRLTKGKVHTCTVWTKSGSHFSWEWGRSGYTPVTDATRKKGKLIQECIEQDFEIYIGDNKQKVLDTLYIKALEDVVHNKHIIKIMYWSSSPDQICCHRDDEFYAYFTSLNEAYKHFENKGYELFDKEHYKAETGCNVEVYEISR